MARILIEPSASRDRLTAGMYLGHAADDPVAQIERALAATIAAEPAEAKLRLAMKSGRFDAKLPPGAGFAALVARAQAAGVITATEAEAVLHAHALTAIAIRVDDFAQDLGTSEMRQDSPAPHVASARSVVHKAAA